jgi:hypothetical protein
MGKEYKISHPRLPNIPSLNPALAILKKIQAIHGSVNQMPPFHESPGTKNPNRKPAKKYSMLT